MTPLERRQEVDDQRIAWHGLAEQVYWFVNVCRRR